MKNRQLKHTEDLIQVRLNQLKKSAAQSRVRAKNSYYFGIFSLAMGQVALAIFISLAFLTPHSYSKIPVISSSFSVVFQLLGAVNLILQHKFDRLSIRYGSEIVEMFNAKLALELIRQVENPQKKSVMTQKLVNSLSILSR